MASIIDVSTGCGTKGSALFAAGVKTVIRYYSRDTTRPSKRLNKDEARSLVSAGLRLCIVHEGRFGDQASNFDRQCGLADGAYARSYGAGTIGQPAGSTIYFGVDFDATHAEIGSRVIPYFQGITDAFAKPTGEPSYVIGIYGSGASCQAVIDAGLAQRAWLAQSTGWSGHAAFLAASRWTMNQQMPTTISGVDCDPNMAGVGQDIGDFTLPVTAIAAQVGAQAMRVIARSGLRLRAGAGVQFDIVKVLPFGTLVYPLKSESSWTMVDLQGDGVADGFVGTSYLSDASSSTIPSSGVLPSAVGTIPPATGSAASGDAIHIPDLITQGSTATGLKAARETAAASLPGYPTNGCAAHLSALLQQAGVDLAMTWGAGKLAHILGDRGWRRIEVGKQQPGDVGVCFDNNPTPPGADHIYLVIQTLGADEMMIADNQRTTDAPHGRFASGHGKTPTEYFLRAG